MASHFSRARVYSRTPDIGPPPEDHLDNHFLWEVRDNCDYAIRAFESMRDIAKTDPSSNSLLALAHMVLVFGANVVRTLDPPKAAPPTTKRRALRLRRQVHFSTTNLDRMRVARNHLEHFDERLERFMTTPATVERTVTIRRMVMDHEPGPATIEGKGDKLFQPRFLKFLNTASWELIVIDERFSIPDIIADLHSIRRSIDEAEHALAQGDA